MLHIQTSVAEFNRIDSPVPEGFSLPADTVFHQTDQYTVRTTNQGAQLSVTGLSDVTATFDIPRASIIAFLSAMSRRTDAPANLQTPGSRGIGPHSKYGTCGLEIGHADGKGFVTVEAPDGYPFTWWVPGDDVSAFLDRRRSNHHLPSPPDGFDDLRSAPYGWTGGDARHKGGGIYCRVWKRDATIDGTDCVLEVIYGVPKCNGVDATMYGPEGAFLGTLTSKAPESEADQTDERCYELATSLMDELDSRSHRETLIETVSQH